MCPELSGRELVVAQLVGSLPLDGKPVLSAGLLGFGLARLWGVSKKRKGLSRSFSVSHSVNLFTLLNKSKNKT